MKTYLYSRVSTGEQTVANQELLAANMGITVPPENCFADSNVSGSTKALERKEFARMFETAQAGDRCYVSAIDRIGRDTVDVLTTLDKFQAKGVHISVLAYGNLDITSEMGRLIITVAAGFAQLERSYLKTRTKQGMARTKLAGTKLGPPLKIAPDTLEALVKDKRRGITLDGLSQKYKIPRNTLSTNLTKWGGKVEDYRAEFKAREVQYAQKKLTTPVRMQQQHQIAPAM